jgi:hypothetical protein
MLGLGMWVFSAKFKKHYFSYLRKSDLTRRMDSLMGNNLVVSYYLNAGGRHGRE